MLIPKAMSKKAFTLRASHLEDAVLGRAAGKVSFWLFVLLLSGCANAVIAESAPKDRVGWLEQVRVTPSDILLHAKLDTGADSCSMHAENIAIQKVGKGKQVSFELVNRYGKRAKLKRQLVRIAKVKKKTGGVQKRPVVRLGVCLGGVYETVECNLVDRSNFAYPVLVGRNYLAGVATVDSSETYISTPNCGSKE
jgi:hypothetical protein